MQIRFAGRYTREELLRLDSAVRKAFGLQKLYTNAGCFTVAAAIGVPLAIAAIMRGDEEASVQWFVLGGAALAIALWQWWSIRRSLKANPLLDQTVEGVFDDEGFEVVRPTSRSRVLWSGVASMLATANHLLLIGTTNELFGFSAAFFSSPADFEAACTLARSHVSGKPPARTGRRILWNTIVWVVVIVLVFLLWSLFQTTKKQ
jgi:hypothetical protein